MSRIRRQMVSYHLLSDSKALFQELIGKRILSMKTGLCGRTERDGSLRPLGPEGESIENKGIGGFLCFDRGRTLSFAHDQLVDSMVVMDVPAGPGDEDFLVHVNQWEPYSRSTYRIHRLVDMPGSAALIGKEIAGVSIYKHPDNFRIDPYIYTHLTEAALGLKFSDNSESLVTCGIGPENAISYIFVLPNEALTALGSNSPEKIWAS